MKQDARLRGFTLVELLITISIIGILSSIVLASLNGARIKARNTLRNQEIIQLRTALNFVYDATGSFPSASGAYVCMSATCYGGWTPPGAGVAYNSTVDALMAPYIHKPVDPTDTTRTSGGFLYFDASTWGGTSTWPPGHYLNWLLEPGANDCGPNGTIYSVDPHYVQCLLPLD